MEEIIKEIEKAESEAAALKAEANKKAADIIAALDVELKSLKESYEQKLRNESALILNETRKKINALVMEQEKKIAVSEKAIKDNAHDKIESCVDFVYDFLLKEIKE